MVVGVVPPPIVLPPAPVVVYNSEFHCDCVEGFPFPVFYMEGYFYCFHHDHWFCTARPGMGWAAVEPRFVPRVLAEHGGIPENWKAYSTGRRHEIRAFHDRLPFPVVPQHAVVPKGNEGAKQFEQYHGTTVNPPHIEKKKVEHGH